ncbi:MAG: hypothetical protein ACFE7R_08125 [Candidatus Hodarchaeota archaeon]
MSTKRALSSDNFRVFLILLFLLVWTGNSNPLTDAFSIADFDYFPTTQWLNSTPSEQGMDESILEDMLNYIEEEDFDRHCEKLICCP